MKIRQGFVSNSSSSNFIVAIPKEIDTAKKLQELLFGSDIYMKYYDDSFSCKDLAEVIFNDIKGQDDRSSDLKHLFEEIVGGSLQGFKYKSKRLSPGQSHWDIDDEKEREIVWKEESEMRAKHAVVQVLRFVDANKEKCNIYTFTYSDNDGAIQSALEHGDVFDNVKHMVSSHH